MKLSFYAEITGLGSMSALGNLYWGDISVLWDNSVAAIEITRLESVRDEKGKEIITATLELCDDSSSIWDDLLDREFVTELSEIPFDSKDLKLVLDTDIDRQETEPEYNFNLVVEDKGCTKMLNIGIN